MLENLWIMRHGLAEAHFETDFNRALSSTGRAQALNVATQLKQGGDCQPTKMLVSPFQRTRDTADIVHSTLEIEEPYQIEEMLVHFADPKTLGDFLLASGEKDLIIVSHMPIVAELCQYLSPGCNIFGFQTAQLVQLIFQQSGNAKVGRIYLPQ